jgi:hypothetical protein
MGAENRKANSYQRALLSIQEAAKQIGTVVPILQAAYFAAISMSDLKRAIWQNWSQSWWLVILFVFPAFLWLISLFLAIQIFVPPTVSPEARTSATYEQLVADKYRLLRISQYFLAAGLLVMALDVIIYFACVPPPLPSK